MRFHMAFPTPAKTVGVPRVEGSCAKRSPAHSPYRRGDGSVQIHPTKPEEASCLASITLCSGSGTRLRSTDVNIFGRGDTQRCLEENHQLWASPSWA